MPQCFIDGELVGGSDIAFEMFESGELQEMLAENADE
jgi:glutaredoxin-related protein